MEVLLEKAVPRLVHVLEERPTAARRAVTTLFFVNGALFATWVSRIPAIEELRLRCFLDCRGDGAPHR
jgi:hypothetical protein